MKWNKSVLLSTGFIILSLLIGCEKSSNMTTQPAVSSPVSQQTQAAVANVISQDPLFTTDADALSDAAPSFSNGDSSISSIVMRRGWGRKIESSNRDIAYDQINDSTVLATITNTLVGQVWIHLKQELKDTTIYKPLSENLIHKAMFIRIPLKDSLQLYHWKMVAVSGTVGGTNNGGIAILSATFFIGGDTVQVLNPLDSLYRFPLGKAYSRGELHEVKSNPYQSFKVQITVRSTDPDSDIVVAHQPYMGAQQCEYRRGAMKLVSSVTNGDGSFTRVYESNWRGAFAGRFHIRMSAITRASIYDNLAPFSSNIWGLPYLVVQ
jgi:hypothetical protein